MEQFCTGTDFVRRKSYQDYAATYMITGSLYNVSSLIHCLISVFL